MVRASRLRRNGAPADAQAVADHRRSAIPGRGQPRLIRERVAAHQFSLSPWKRPTPASVVSSSPTLSFGSSLLSSRAVKSRRCKRHSRSVPSDHDNHIARSDRPRPGRRPTGVKAGALDLFPLFSSSPAAADYLCGSEAEAAGALPVKEHDGGGSVRRRSRRVQANNASEMEPVCRVLKTFAAWPPRSSTLPMRSCPPSPYKPTSFATSVEPSSPPIRNRTNQRTSSRVGVHRTEVPCTESTVYSADSDTRSHGPSVPSGRVDWSPQVNP